MHDSTSLFIASCPDGDDEGLIIRSQGVAADLVSHQARSLKLAASCSSDRNEFKKPGPASSPFSDGSAAPPRKRSFRCGRSAPFVSRIAGQHFRICLVVAAVASQKPT